MVEDAIDQYFVKIGLTCAWLFCPLIEKKGRVIVATEASNSISHAISVRSAL